MKKCRCKAIASFFKKHIRWFGFLILTVILAYSYLSIFFVPRALVQDLLYALFFAFLILGLFLEYKLEQKKVEIKTHWQWQEGLAASIGVLATFAIVFLTGISAVIASAAIGLLGFLLVKKYQVAIYCGSFAGMVSTTLFSIHEVVLLALVCGLVYLLTKPLFSGLGGKLGTVAFISSLLTFAIFSKNYEVVDVQLNLILVLLVSVVGTVSTYLVQHRLHQSAVFASAITSLVFALLVTLVWPSETGYAVVFFAASFLGMSSQERLPNIFVAFWASLILGLVFDLLISVFHGLGGKLGLMALMSIMMTSGILYVYRLIQKKLMSDRSK